MHIHIIGAGAVGLFIASKLIHNKAVSVITRTEQQAHQINNYGIHIVQLDGSIEKNMVDATKFYNIKDGDVVIVAVKYAALQDVYKNLEKYSNITILFLQNGLAHFEEALALPAHQIVFGAAQFGVKKVNAYTVEHRGIGVLKLAVARGNASCLGVFANINSSLLPIEWVEDAQAMLFEKALLNCFINPITSILQIQNGELIENPAAFQLLQQLYAELMDAFPHMRQVFPFEAVQALCEQTAQNTSSMLADRLAGRRTEIVTIVGAIIKRAPKPLPTLQTLYYLVEATDDLGGE